MSDYPDYLVTYASVAAIIGVGVALAAGMLGANRLFRPALPDPAKLLTYESGVDPVGTGWAQSNVRYYVYAFLYVIFAVDAVFLFPWAVVFASIGWAAAVEMAVFLGFIAVGLVYAWRTGVLSWT
ncbi:NADH-quinone oxidoreductase subunit A [Mumia sp. zg.B53]|uniref:NADH-quinone oxidoreductase subunit A n=1 Tax=unclassified Mumia TaxID=2621872 RepID=UPI001C6DFC89|nr:MULTISPECIES: NADH-quinone oxidoreductase subunit A [unclassified Mumia]MBW9204621.1 NADH-quinone oxidoreductase subunit A [Mumia sp. zg.B17]MBW9209374.1 NADH-quinone oxidoreductase subunit A [Mumia sp. zg.B21]MBW9213983.1 NADH-quinone oxidoreductase subunit A [Mumia sp. zg.B53]MDD9347231.1 NADH-quinone oxidoreductase subunit A [Mumia sp.]